MEMFAIGLQLCKNGLEPVKMFRNWVNWYNYMEIFGNVGGVLI